MSDVTLDNVFEKIVAGDLPCHKVYEDDRVLAFLDLGPLSRGHTLVIPKHKALTVAELPEADAAAIGAALPKIMRALLEATGATACNILQNNGSEAGQVVRHVHFHLIPKYADGSGLPFEWPKGELDQEEGAALASNVAACF